MTLRHKSHAIDSDGVPAPTPDVDFVIDSVREAQSREGEMCDTVWLSLYSKSCSRQIRHLPKCITSAWRVPSLLLLLCMCTESGRGRGEENHQEIWRLLHPACYQGLCRVA